MNFFCLPLFKANIPVVSVSLHSSLDATTNINIGKALAPLREEEVLILGSGYSFHNMNAFFNPSRQTVQASKDFNNWLKDTILKGEDKMLNKLQQWSSAPGGRICHPREEHLLPLLMAAAAGTDSLGRSSPMLIYDTTKDENGQTEHAVTGYLFQ